jgi:hypothetical protein
MSWSQCPVFLPMRNRLEVTILRGIIWTRKRVRKIAGPQIGGRVRLKLRLEVRGARETKGADGIKKLNALA